MSRGPTDSPRAHQVLPRWPWLWAMRPQTLPVGAAPVLLATALAAAAGGMRTWLFVCALGGSLAIQVGTNLFNDWADAKRGADGIDRLGPVRVTQQGLLAAPQVLRASLLCFALAAAFGTQLLQQGGALVLAVGTLSIIAGVLYTGGPYPLAYHGWGDVFAFIFFGPVPTVTTYYLHRGHTDGPPWLLGLSMGAFAAAVLAVNNLRDRFSDARANKRTLAVRLGPRAVRRAYVALLASAYLLALLLAGHAFWHGAPPWPLTTWLSAPWAVARARAVLHLDGAALNAQLAATARLQAVYALLACAGCLAAAP